MKEFAPNAGALDSEAPRQQGQGQGPGEAPAFTVAECVELARELAEHDPEECWRRLTLSGRYQPRAFYYEPAAEGGAR